MLYTTSIFLQLFSILSQFQRFQIFYPYYSFYAFHSFDLFIAVTGNSQIIVKPKKTNYESKETKKCLFDHFYISYFLISFN